MAECGDAYVRILKTVPGHVMLLAVSKHHAVEDIEDVYHAGCRNFGENKVQELSQKAEILPKDINWHFIGHLQSNKVKYIAPYVSLIHGVDSVKLLKVIDKEAKKNNRRIDVLLQVKIAEEDSKFGLTYENTLPIVKDSVPLLENIRLVGLMGMATNTADQVQIRDEFKKLNQLFNSVKDVVADKTSFSVLSMGMSRDYVIAIEEGSTLVRMGTSIFGARY